MFSQICVGKKSNDANELSSASDSVAAHGFGHTGCNTTISDSMHQGGIPSAPHVENVFNL